MRCPACNESAEPWRTNVYVCSSCGSSRRTTDANLVAASEHYATYYDNLKHPASPTRARLEEWARALAPYRASGRLLEVGCGAGHFLEVVRTHGFEPWGTEISKSALEILGKRGFRVLNGELTNHDLPPSHFDAIVLFEVIEHLDDPSKYLAEFRRLLRDGGVLMLTTPNFGSLSRRLLNERWRVLQPEHRVVFSSRGISLALDRAGLRVVSVTSRNLDPLEVLRVLRGRPISDGRERQTALDELRRAIAARPVLGLIRGVVDKFLNFLGLGDTLVVWAERQSDR